MRRAGLPTTTACGGTSSRTTAPAPDEGLLPDLDPREEHGSAADSRAAADRGAFAQGVPRLGSPHEVVVRRDDAGRDEDVLLQGRVGGDVRVRLDGRPGAHGRVVLDERAAADDDAVAEVAALPYAGLVADDDAASRAGCRRKRRRRRGWRVPSPTTSGGSFGAARGRAGAERRRLSDDGVVADHDVLSRAPCPGRRPRSRRSARSHALSLERGLELLERCARRRARRAQQRGGPRPRGRGEEVLALEPQRLLVGDARAVDVARCACSTRRRCRATARRRCRRPSPCGRAPCRRRRPSCPCRPPSSGASCAGRARRGACAPPSRKGSAGGRRRRPRRPASGTTPHARAARSAPRRAGRG